MSKPAKPAIVRYYVDADVLGLAKILVQIRGDVTKGGRVRAPCPITDVGTADHVWITETARQEWLIITRTATSKITGPRSKPSVLAVRAWSTWLVMRPSGRSRNLRSLCASGGALPAF